MMRILIPVVLLAGLLLNGCASSVEMTPADRKKTQAVSINPVVFKGPIRVVTMGQALTMGLSGVVGGAVGGGIAGAVQASTPNEPAARATAIMDKNGIRVEEMVREEFIRQAGDRHLFTLVDAKGDAEMEIIIPTWGLMVPDPYQWALRPCVTAMVLMSGPSGRVIWKDAESSTHLNLSVPRHTLDEYAAKPELLRDGFHRAVATAVTKLMENYARN